MTDSASNIGTRSYRTKQWGLTLLLTTVALFLSIAAHAQDESQIKDALRIEKPPLKIELRTLTPMVCLGMPLKLRLEVTNVDQETLRINRAYFWNNYFEYLTTSKSKDKDTEFFFTHIWPRSTSEDIVLLPPGKTYVAHTYWPLHESVTKYGAGNYTLETGTYGTLSKVQFELHDCKQKELRSKDEY